MFVIQCTTCRTRLKVHDSRLLGDIVECPKCGSFVEVTPPAGWQTAASAVVTPTPPKQASTVPPSTSGGSSLLSTPPPLPLQGTTTAVGKSSISAATNTSRLIVSDPPSDPTWLARGIGQLRNHWILAACGFTGGVVAAIVLSLMFSSSTPSEPDPVSLISPSRLQTIPDAPGIADNSAEETVTDATITEGSSEKVDEVPKSNTLASSSDTADKNKSETTVPSPSTSVSEENQYDPSSEDGLQPSSLNHSYEDSAKVTQKEITPTDVSAIESSEERQLDPAKQAQMLAHFQDKLPTVEFNNVGLGQFVAFLTAYSTVPITIDTESLLETGKSAKTHVSVKLTDTTVEAALKAALTKRGLTFRVEPGRIVIIAVQPK